MEVNKKKKKYFPVLINKFSLEILFAFFINSLEYYEQVEDPFSKCLTNFKQIEYILGMEEKKSIFFFFFLEKLYKIYFMKVMLFFQ